MSLFDFPRQNQLHQNYLEAQRGLDQIHGSQSLGMGLNPNLYIAKQSNIKPASDSTLLLLGEDE